MAGLKSYFDTALPRILLYAFERQQYTEFMSKREREGALPCTVYGPEHLLRLFGTWYRLSVLKHVAGERPFCVGMWNRRRARRHELSLIYVSGLHDAHLSMFGVVLRCVSQASRVDRRHQPVQRRRGSAHSRPPGSPQVCYIIPLHQLNPAHIHAPSEPATSTHICIVKLC